jgi:membrane peptidoglycan carboxypeptidase
MGCSMLVSLLAATAIISSALIYTQLVRDLPSLELLPTLLNPVDGQLLQPTRIVDRSGQHILLTLQDSAAQGSQYLLLASPVNSTSQESQNNLPGASQASTDYLPATLIAATIASAEPGFWSGSGFSVGGILRGSHPTIAQKVVSDLLLWGEPVGLRRALRERLLAAQITARYGKDQILEWYLNSASYGHLIFGADAAARVYFAKPASELSLAESAWLAAIAQRPLSLPDTEQQEIVLQAMLKQGLIDSRQADQAKSASPAFQERVPASQDLVPAFTRYVLSELEQVIDRSRLERGGLQIYTSLNYELQLQVACTVNAQLARLEGQPTGSVVEPDCPAARLLPTLAFDSDNNTQNLAANVIVLDPKTGEILALVGEPVFGLDPTASSGRLPGTMLTPALYLTAFTRGLSPASLLWDIPSAVEQLPYQNFDGSFHGPLRLRSAFANDYVVPAAQLFERLGPENVLRTARQLGLSSLEEDSETGGAGNLHSGEVTLLELTRSFGIFANQGSLSGRSNSLPSRGLLAPSVETASRPDQDTNELGRSGWIGAPANPDRLSRLNWLI